MKKQTKRLETFFLCRELIDYAGLFDDFGCEDGVFDPEYYINYVDTSDCLAEEDLDLSLCYRIL